MVRAALQAGGLRRRRQHSKQWAWPCWEVSPGPERPRPAKTTVCDGRNKALLPGRGPNHNGASRAAPQRGLGRRALRHARPDSGRQSAPPSRFGRRGSLRTPWHRGQLRLRVAARSAQDLDVRQALRAPRSGTRTHSPTRQSKLYGSASPCPDPEHLTMHTPDLHGHDTSGFTLSRHSGTARPPGQAARQVKVHPGHKAGGAISGPSASQTPEARSRVGTMAGGSFQRHIHRLALEMAQLWAQTPAAQQHTTRGPPKQ